LRSGEIVSPEDNTQPLTEHRLRTEGFGLPKRSIYKLFPDGTVHIRVVLTTFRRSLLSASGFMEHRQYSKHLHGTFTQKEDKNLKMYAYLLIKNLGNVTDRLLTTLLKR